MGIRDNVIILDYQSNVEDYFSLFDIFIFPSVHERFRYSRY